MSLNASKSRLVAVTKELSLQWDETKHHWKDAKSQEFEHRYLEELFLNVDRAVTAIEKLNGLLNQVRSDCE